jgi:hypothetical protein
MSIFAAPAFYNQADQNIYSQGYSFIPQEKFRGGAFNFPTSSTTTGGVTTLPVATALNIGGGGGGGSNPFNPDMNQIRTDFRPDTEFRRFNEFGITSLDDVNKINVGTMDDPIMVDSRKTMESYPEYFGLETGVPKDGIAGFMDKAVNFIPGAGMLKRIGPFIQNILPVNERAILENQARGIGVLTDDIGRIVAGGDYNTPEGVMAGYNLNKVTDATFDKRQDRIGQTLGEKYGISASDVQGLIDGTLDDDDISAKYGITTNLTSQIRNIELARQNILGARTKAQEIRDFRELQRIDAINKKKAEAKAKGDAARARALQIKAAAKTQGISRREAERQQQAIEQDYSDDRGGDVGAFEGSTSGYDEGNYCFDPNTFIQMADGSEKKIKEIQLGDQTKGGEVTGVFQFKASDEIHDYKGVTVAGSHYVKENGRFIMVQDSPISVKIDKIPVVYSLDTTGRRIFIKDIEFADYNGDGIAKGFLANAGVNLTGFDKEVLRQVENRLI